MNKTKKEIEKQERLENFNQTYLEELKRMKAKIKKQSIGNTENEHVSDGRRRWLNKEIEKYEEKLDWSEEK